RRGDRVDGRDARGGRRERRTQAAPDAAEAGALTSPLVVQFSMPAKAKGLALLAATAVALAQGGFGGPPGPFSVRPNTRYDGRFTFVRLNYTTAPGGYWYRGWPAWAHGYPIAEQNLMKILDEITTLDGHLEINTLSFDDPELFKYPVAYVIEVGWWMLN